MERLALQKLEKWNNSPYRKPLVISGARKVGKTYLVKELFAEKYYKNNYIYIDLKIEKDIKDFSLRTANANKIIEFISLKNEKRITKDTLLIFDEVQECPNIISSLKYFCQDHREIPVIATGTMFWIRIVNESYKNREKNHFLFPVGNINHIKLFPMTFDEFLLNSNPKLYNKVKFAYINKTKLKENIHALALDEVYKYLLIGGMPEVVKTYLNTGNLHNSREILKSIYINYQSDTELYQANKKVKLRTKLVLNNIYAELMKESKNFTTEFIEKGSKKRSFIPAIEWLTNANFIYKSSQVDEKVTLPLIQGGYDNFRLYLSDIGLFTYQSGEGESLLKIIPEIIYENYVASELIAKGNDLYYWKGKSLDEIEFLVQSDYKIYPLQVKKESEDLTSLKEFKRRNKYECAIKISTDNYGYDREKNILTIPLYFVSFLVEDFKQETFTYKAE